MSTRASIRPEPSIEEARQIQEFWNEHHTEFLARYPEQFVAVKDETVVASNRDLAVLVDQLRQMGLDPRTDVAIEFISAKSGSLLL